MNELIIYGAGGSARETAWLAEQECSLDGRSTVVAFIDDDPARHGKHLHGVPIMSLEMAAHRHPGARCVIAVGGAADRERLARRVAATGLPPATLVHPRAELSDRVSIGAGTVICAGCVLTVDVVIGAHVQINIGCTISHDAVIGDFTTFAPGVHTSGWVHIGKRVHLGTGAVVINGRAGEPLTIGDDAVIAAGAVVTRPVPAGTTVAGMPARPLPGPDDHFTAST